MIFNENDLLLVLTNESNDKNAKQLAEVILKKKLAACITFSNISSIYWWKDKLVNGDEVQLLIKTRLDLIHKVNDLIKKFHSYEVPEIIYLNACASKEYKEWLYEMTFK
ncbi:divalent-cation tolerance protein CutA [Prochlorococcus marinus]|uniref:divalent-cation tolerance protein CutA n=1 Tax=Prochlorococcus marinus TaxID=1219 RepID=UPI0022B5B2F8|nr:divalent-cation tolerance protein CutA [Prochlorococcus marinus]